MRLEHRHQHFQRRVARACAQAGHGSVDAHRTGFQRGERVGHAHGQVVVAVKAHFGFRLQRLAQRADVLCDTSSGSM